MDAVRLDSWTIHGGLNLHDAMSFGVTNLPPVANAGPGSDRARLRVAMASNSLR